MEHEGSLPYSYKNLTGSYSGLNESNPPLPMLFL